MKDDLIQEKIALVMAEVFEIKIEAINEKTSNKNIDNWDSLHQIKLTVAIEDEFDVEFEPEEIATMTSLKSIATIVKDKLL